MLLSIIGLGKIGTALVKGMLDADIFTPEEIIGSDINVKERDNNSRFGGIETTISNKKGAEKADIILLAVKPQVIDYVLEDIKGVADNKLIVSIAAGVTTSHLERMLPQSCRIIRAMPNTPALVKSGITAISPHKKASSGDINIVRDIFGGVGEVIVVQEELMDAITGLSGSGPAYVYMIIEALADGGVLTGLSRDVSLKLAAQTVLGSAKMVLKTNKHPGELKDMVTSPGGTSIRGIEVLESHGLRGILIDAVKEATERSKQMNNM